MLTVNQNIEIFKNFFLRSLTLNSYYHEGENMLVENSNDALYPKLETILESSDTTGDMANRKWTVYVSDLVDVDLKNRRQVISDTEQTCRDLLYYLRKIVKDGTIPGFRVTKDITMTDFTESGNDNVSGWFFEITISSHVGNSSCNLPVGTGTIFDGDYIYVGGTYTAITSNTMIKQDEFTYDGNPMVLTYTPVVMINAYAGASLIKNIDDYAIASKTVTPITDHPFIEIGTKIVFTYTYTS